MVIDSASALNNETGLYQLANTWKDGRQQDIFTSYLFLIMPRDGLEIWSGATVASFIYKEKAGKQRATGVVYLL